MPSDKDNSSDYKTLTPHVKNGGAKSDNQTSIKLSAKQNRENPATASQSLTNPDLDNTNLERKQKETPADFSSETFSEKSAAAPPENSFPPVVLIELIGKESALTEPQRQKKQEKKDEKDRALLDSENWLVRNNHGLTYIGIFLFTLVVYFRPYELIPALSSLTSLALVLAVATVLIYLPSQLVGESSLMIFTTEVKCMLFIAFWAVLTIPVAIDPSLAWETFNNTFSKVLVIFIVMVSTVRTAGRLKGLMWLAIGAGVMISCQSLYLYQQGIFKTEGYRVNIGSSGMFGNPNDMAIHLVIFVPIAIGLGLATKNILARFLYFAIALLMIGGIVVTQSRGGFLGLIAVGAVLVWKLGKNQRFKAVLISAIVGLIFIAVAPGNYGLRILSIFIPSLDPVGSAGQRSELLQLSLIVTLRHPLGIGIGNFPIVSFHNLQTHNAYTQVSSELGWLAAAAYVYLMVSPIRKLAAIERRLFASDKEDAWIYFLAVGVQASIIGYMVASFFGPVAYNWYVYYPIAYAVCLRRIYQIRQSEKGIEVKAKSTTAAEDDYFSFQNVLNRQVK